MKIRDAKKDDVSRISDLLLQVLDVHHTGRPDLFKQSSRKYTDIEYYSILQQKDKKIFVAADENNLVIGYVFCMILQQNNHNMLTNIKTLYIDDLCVDTSARGMRIGRLLFDAAKSYASKIGCYNVTLNVWSCNPSALHFYEQCGLQPQKIGMELIL